MDVVYPGGVLHVSEQERVLRKYALSAEIFEKAQIAARKRMPSKVVLYGAEAERMERLLTGIEKSE